MQAAGPKFRVHFNPYENAIDDFMRCAGIVRPEEFRYPASRRPTNAGPASAGLIGGLCQGVHGFPLVPERRSGYSDAAGTISCPIAAPNVRQPAPPVSTNVRRKPALIARLVIIARRYI